MRLDGEAAGVAGEPLGGLGADRACALEHRRRVVAEVHDQRGGAALHAVGAVAAVPGEGDERVGGGLLPVEDRCRRACRSRAGSWRCCGWLARRRCLLERQAPAERELAAAVRPRHAERAPLVELLVVGHLGRDDRARRERDRAGRLADSDACDLGIALGRRERGGGCDLVERERACAQRVVECGQVRGARRWCW